MDRILKNKNSLCEIFSWWHQSRKIRAMLCGADGMALVKNRNISQSKKAKTALIVLCSIFLFLLVNINRAQAEGTCQCMNTNGIGLNNRTPVGDQFTSASNKECELACQSKSAERYCYSSTPGPCIIDEAVAPGETVALGANASQAKKVALAGASQIFVTAIQWVLTQVQALMGWLFGIAATLFGVVVDPANVSGKNGILNKQAVKDVWIMVRDVLNMFFILVLLFSAFCTIFQVEKWNLKKVWLSVLINALLVNFSFPIARFFIDVSNVTMYYFINHLFNFTGTVNGSSIMASLGGVSDITAILKPSGYADDSIAYQIAMIVFLFIFGMTLMIIAVLFVIRLVALTMLIMFSPIGFVGYIFPATSQYASDWWKKLLSYSFFGPIMIFMMAIALQVAKAINNDNSRSFMSYAGANSTNGQANWIASTAFYFIPVIILWMGMGVAKAMGVAGAETVVGKAQGFAKGIGSWAAKAPWKATKFGANATGIPGGLKQRYNKFTGGFSAKQKQREARWATKFGVAGAMETDLKNRSEQYKKDNISAEELSAKSAKGDMAAALRLAEDGKVKAMDYGNIQKHLKGKGAEQEKVLKLISAKVEKKNIDAIIEHRISGIDKSFSAAKKLAEEDRIAAEEFGKLNADSWKSQENLGKMFDSSNPKNKPHIRNGGKAFNSMAQSARADAAKSMSGTTAANVKTAGFKI